MRIREIVGSAAALQGPAMLNEGRDAPLFHFTAKLMQILDDDALAPGDRSQGAVSLTRDLHTPFFSYFAKPDRDCLVLNQRLLAQRFKISPEFGDSREELPELMAKHREDGHDIDPARYVPRSEQEERVFGTIKPLSQFLVAVVVDDNFLDSGDISMRWVKRVSNDHALTKIMKVGLYSKKFGTPVVERAALRRNGTWSADITKKVQSAAVRLSKKPQ